MNSISALAVDPLAQNGLANINTAVLVVALVIVLLVSFAIAFRHRHHYQAKGMLREYAIFSAIFLVGSLLLQLKLVLIIGLLLAGLIVTALRSNHYFYQK